MNNICPICEKETKIEIIKEESFIRVREDNVPTLVEFSKCDECGETFENTRGHDALDLAYREYRRRHEMLQPEDIRDWRKKFGLTQKTLSALLGWGEATLSRYENGALQDEAHEKMLRMAMEPHNLLNLIRKSTNVISEEKKKQLIVELSVEETIACSLERIIEMHYENKLSNEYTGFYNFNLSKLYNAILFFCKGGQLKTKLNKLLFYADFKHFKEYAVPITGSQYIHLNYGPVPDNYEMYLISLTEKECLNIEEMYFYDYIGESLVSAKEPDLSCFDTSEIKILAEIKEYFKDYTASQIKDFSHEELGYTNTKNREPISYKFSESLRI